MKELIKKEIMLSKMNNLNNSKYIMRLQQMIDADVLTIEDFSDTGLLYERKDFESMFGAIELHDRCTDVMRYVGGSYIQFLDNGRYLLNIENKIVKNSKNIS